MIFLYTCNDSTKTRVVIASSPYHSTGNGVLMITWFLWLSCSSLGSFYIQLFPETFWNSRCWLHSLHLLCFSCGVCCPFPALFPSCASIICLHAFPYSQLHSTLVEIVLECFFQHQQPLFWHWVICFYILNTHLLTHLLPISFSLLNRRVIFLNHLPFW